MPLLTVQTRLEMVLAAGKTLRRSAAQSASRLSTEVAADELVSLCNHFRGLINDIAPFAADAAVSAEADRQFNGQAGWSAGSLLTLIAGCRQLAEAAIAEIRRIVPQSNGHPLVKRWNDDGTCDFTLISVNDAATLRTILQQIVAAIPE